MIKEIKKELNKYNTSSKRLAILSVVKWDFWKTEKYMPLPDGIISYKNTSEGVYLYFNWNIISVEVYDILKKSKLFNVKWGSLHKYNLLIVTNK